jgi:TP901 family phage tail tape measure protein
VEKAGSLFFETAVDDGAVDGADKVAVKVGSRLAKAFTGIGGMINTATVAIIASLGVGMVAGTRAAIEFEDAFAMVKKTMADVEDPKVFEKIADDLQRLATQIPVRASELAALGSVAGQLGVASEDVSKFVEVTGKLGVATNMTGEQAATSLARFLNVTNQTTDEVDKFAAILVQLGNNVAAQESEIILLAQNLGAVASVAGLGATEVLAFSAAMRETGQQSSAGATALGKFFMALKGAEQGDAQALFKFAEVAGTSVTEMADLIETDIGRAATLFLDGLNEMNAQGQSTIAVLQSLGLNQARTSRALLSLANNSEGLAEAIALANAEAISQNALNEEAATRFETVSQKTAQFKSIMNVAGQQIGEIFLPFVSKLMDGLITLAKGFVGLIRGVKELGTIAKVVFGTGIFLGIKNLFTSIGGAFAKTGAAGGTLTKILSKIFGVVKGLLGPLLALVAAFGAIFKIGQQQEAFEEFDNTVASIGDTFEELQSKGGDFGENFTKETQIALAEKFPEAMREGIKAAIDSGDITEEATEFAAQMGDAMNTEITRSLRTGLGVGDVFFGGQIQAELAKSIEQMEQFGGVDVFGPILTTAKELTAEANFTNGQLNEQGEALKQILFYYLSIAEATQSTLTPQQALRQELENVLEATGETDENIARILADEKLMLKVAKSLSGEFKQFGPLIEAIPFKDVTDQMITAQEQLSKNAEIMRQVINDIFEPTEMKFAVEMAEFDVLDAIKEQNELKQEGIDLNQEDVELGEELARLKASELLSEEEILDIQEKTAEIAELQNKHRTEGVMTLEEQRKQQDLITEALEIEDRIRRGMLLTANEQLQKEKLKKDLRKVELAASQGSLEFADLEAEAIREKIKEIDNSAVSAEDAEILRAKAAETGEKAQLRRKNELNKIEKLTGEIQKTNDDALIQRQKEIEDIEKRRVEINEQLLELPRKMKEANFEVLNSQKELANKNLDLLSGFKELGTVVESEAMRMAKDLGLPFSTLQGMENIINTLKNDSGAFINTAVGRAGLDGNTFVEPGQSSAQSTVNRVLDAGAMHQGGMMKAGSRALVGEFGPEIIKTMPGGGAMVSKIKDFQMSQGGGNIVNVNVTGLPTDPIAARRIAQNIQRELNKLAKDGRSGIVR